MPRGIPNKPIDTNEMDTAKKTHIDMPVEGILDRSAMVEEGDILVVSGADKDYADELAFMEEMVEVEVHESTDLNAAPMVDLYCNGVVQRLARGVPQWVKRKYVQILASARPYSMMVHAGKSNDGETVNRINKHSALRYPFRVVTDKNPRGSDWLRKQIQGG